jgi:hypothetical protein
MIRARIRLFETQKLEMSLMLESKNAVKKENHEMVDSKVHGWREMDAWDTVNDEVVTPSTSIWTLRNSEHHPPPRPCYQRLMQSTLRNQRLAMYTRQNAQVQCCAGRRFRESP